MVTFLCEVSTSSLIKDTIQGLWSDQRRVQRLIMGGGIQHGKAMPS